MKRNFYQNIITLVLLTINGTVRGQEYINIQNIFDVGINIGYLTSHAQSGTGSESYEIWKENAKAEWAASISPAPPALVLSKPYQIGFGTDMQNIEFSLLMLSSTCNNPWYRAVRSLFLSANAIARSYVIAGGACTGCLRNEMILAAIYLENASAPLMSGGQPAGSTLKSLGEALRTSALAMRSVSGADDAARQNMAMAPGILSTMTTINDLLEDLNMDCSGRVIQSTPSSDPCDPAAQNHHLFNAGLALGMLNYATMIDIPIERLTREGWYIDEAILQYTSACCLDPSFLIDLKNRMTGAVSSRGFYAETTNHLNLLGSTLAACACDAINSASIYSVGVTLGWAEFAALQDVSADYIANTYLTGAITHLQASNCLSPARVTDLRGRMITGGSSRTFYGEIQAIRTEISDLTLSGCSCGSGTSTGTQTSGSEVVERTSLCGEVNEAGGNAPERHTIKFKESSGTFRFSYNTLDIPDRLQVFNGDQLLFDSDCIGTKGWVEQQLTLAGSDQVVVNIIPNCNGSSATQWYFKVSCPVTGSEIPGTTAGKTKTGFDPAGSDKKTSPAGTAGTSASSANGSVGTIPQAPRGPKDGEWWYPVEKDHPWRGKSLNEIIQLGGVLQMYTHHSMSPNSYYLTDKNGQWINFNPGTHGPSTYYYVDWSAFNKYYALEAEEPIVNDGTLWKKITYKKKENDQSLEFRVYRQSDFNPQTAFATSVDSWAIGENHPWFGKSEKDLKEMGLKPKMYFRNSMDYNTNIYVDPMGQLILSNGRWRKIMYVLDWKRFQQNYQLIEEGHMFQKWKHMGEGHVKQLYWL